MGYLGLSCLSLAVEAKELSLVVDWLSSEEVKFLLNLQAVNLLLGKWLES